MGRTNPSAANNTAAFSQLQAENDALKKENRDLRQKLERMSELLLNAQRARFGSSSEKQDYVMPNQVGIFNEAEAEQDPKAPEPTEETILVPAHTRKPKRTMDELAAGLPVKEILITLPEEELICDVCGSKMAMIGKKLVSRRLEVIPRQCSLLEYYAVTYACKPCEEKIWAREGVALSRATMANWVIRTAQTWLKPLYRTLKKELLGSSTIYADETVVQVLKEDGKAAVSESRMWVYAGSERSGQSVRYFEYQPNRSGKHAAAFLKGFHGCLVTDGYAGYNQVEGVTRCGCWAHMRRKWREAMPPGATKENSKAAVGYDYCSKLFAAERKYAHLSSSVRKTARQVEAEPLLEAYWWWVNTLEPTPGSKLAEAVTYARNQKEYLNSFLEHGEVDISNNYAENAIRPFTVGRKNWLFCDTPKGADASAIVYTVVETAKANGLEPYRYLKLLLTELPYLGKAPSQEDLMQFLPWSKTMQAACTELKTNINAPRDL